VLLENADKARALVKAVAPRLRDRAHVCDKGCHTALEAALITAPQARDPKMAAKLECVAGRVLKKA
jgi:5'-methylthioadenosine phosphorylase